MTKIMTPSADMITDGQIDKAGELFRSMLKARRRQLPSEPVQRVLTNNEVWPAMFAVFQKYVDAVSNIITRLVRVDRTRTATQVIDATGRHKWYVDQEVLAEMPFEGKAEDNAEIFELDYDPTVDQLDQEYEARGLRPDPVVAAQVVIDDPAFADERPLAVQWRDKKGRACCAIFRRHDGQREVNVHWRGRRWYRYCRFVGVRK